MNKEERLQLENELLMTCSKAQAINKYIDALEENSKLSELWCDSRAKIRELKNQQKEFIEYLENYIKEMSIQNINSHPSRQIILETIIDTLKANLSKYKEIIGG